MMKLKEQKHQIKQLIFFFFVCIHLWLQNKGKILIWREYYNQFSIYQRDHVSPLVLQRNNLSNPEAYSEPCQTFKMEC